MNNNSTTFADAQEPVLKDLLARPLRDLRVSLTDQCNLRCTYCMPAEIFDQEHAFLQKDQLIRLEELERLIGAISPRIAESDAAVGEDPVDRLLREVSAAADRTAADAQTVQRAQALIKQLPQEAIASLARVLAGTVPPASTIKSANRGTTTTRMTAVPTVAANASTVGYTSAARTRACS